MNADVKGIIDRMVWELRWTDVIREWQTAYLTRRFQRGLIHWVQTGHDEYFYERSIRIPFHEPGWIEAWAKCLDHLSLSRRSLIVWTEFNYIPTLTPDDQLVILRALMGYPRLRLVTLFGWDEVYERHCEVWERHLTAFRELIEECPTLHIRMFMSPDHPFLARWKKLGDRVSHTDHEWD